MPTGRNQYIRAATQRFTDYYRNNPPAIPYVGSNLVQNSHNVYGMGPEDSILRGFGIATGRFSKQAAKASYKTAVRTLNKAGHRWMNKVGTSRLLGSHLGRSSIALGVGAAVGVYTLGKSMMNQLRWSSPSEQVQKGAGFGPGYISWAKKQGMPANHLGTRNLTNSLHRMRHNSII